MAVPAHEHRRHGRSAIVVMIGVLLAVLVGCSDDAGAPKPTDLPSVRAAMDDLHARGGSGDGAQRLGTTIGQDAAGLVDDPSNGSAAARLGRALGAIQAGLRSRDGSSADRAFALELSWHGRAGYDDLAPEERARRIL